MPKLQLIAVKMEGKTVESFKLADITSPVRAANGLVDKTQPFKTSWFDMTAVADMILTGKAQITGIQSNGLFLEGSNGSFNRYANLKIVEQGKKYPLTVFERVNINGVDGCTVIDVDGRILTVSMDKLVKYAEAVGISNGKVVEHNGMKFISSIRGEYNRVGAVADYEKKIEPTEEEGEVQLFRGLKRGGVNEPGYWPEGAKLRDEKLNLTVEEKFIVCFKAIQNWNFFIYSILSNLTFVPLNPRVMTMPTMAVDLKMQLVYNPYFVIDLSLENLILILLHETYHILFSHPARIAEMQLVAKRNGTKTGLPFKEELMMYNIAADLFVNKYIADQFNCTTDSLTKFPHTVVARDPFVTNNTIKKWSRGVKNVQFIEGLACNDKVDCEKDSIETLFKDLIEQQRREMEEQREKEKQQQSNNESSDDDDENDTSTSNNCEDENNASSEQDRQDEKDEQDSDNSNASPDDNEQSENSGLTDDEQKATSDNQNDTTNGDDEQSGNDDGFDENDEDNDTDGDSSSDMNKDFGDDENCSDTENNTSSNEGGTGDGQGTEDGEETDSEEGDNSLGNNSSTGDNSDDDTDADYDNESNSQGEHTSKGKSRSEIGNSGSSEDADYNDNDYDDIKDGENCEESLEDCYSKLNPRDMSERHEDITSKLNEYKESYEKFGSDLKPDKDETGQDNNNTSDLTPEQYQEKMEDLKNWKDKLKSTVLKAEVASQQRGLSLSAAERRLVDAIIKPVPINWKILLKRMFNMAAQKQSSYKRPSRRPDVGKDIVLPGKAHKEPNGLEKIVFAIDTSGSVGDRELRYVLGTIRALTDKYKVDVDVMWWSTYVNGIVPINSTKDLVKAYQNVASDGGTNAENMFKYITNKQGPYKGKQLHGLIIFTDGYIGDVPVQYKIAAKNILWMIHSRTENSFNAPFGTTAYIEAE